MKNNDLLLSINDIDFEVIMNKYCPKTQANVLDLEECHKNSFNKFNYELNSLISKAIINSFNTDSKLDLVFIKRKKNRIGETSVSLYECSNEYNCELKRTSIKAINYKEFIKDYR